MQFAGQHGLAAGFADRGLHRRRIGRDQDRAAIGLAARRQTWTIIGSPSIRASGLSGAWWPSNEPG